jgi:hypothetical protein
MAIEIWIDRSSHWKVSGQVESSGKMTDGTVIDNNGTERSRNETFSSRPEFSAWVKRH